MCRCDCCTVYSVVADIRGTRTRRKSWLTFFFFLLLLYVCGVCCGERIFRERREKTIKRWLHRLSRVTMLLSSTLSSRLHSRWLELFIFFFCSLALLLVRCNSMCTFPLSLLRFAPPPPSLLLCLFRMTVYPQYGRYHIRGKKEKKKTITLLSLFYSLPVRPVVRKDANVPHVWVAAGDRCDLFRLHPRLRLHPILDADVVSRAEHLATHLRRRRTGPTRICTLHGSRGRVQQPGRDAAHLRQGSSA